MLERSIGFLTHAPEIQEGPIATRLQPLKRGGLYLTRTAALAEVRPTTDPETLEVRRFGGSPDTVWESVRVCLPEVWIGESLPRFWLVQEATAYPATALHGVLDLVTLDVLERGSHREDVLRRVAGANANPAMYLREVARARTREIVRAALGEHDTAEVSGAEAPAW